MESRNLRAWLCAAGLLTAATSASAVIVDVSALNGNGTIVHLAAGTYDVRYIGPDEGGLYTAWNPWSSVSGCNSDGMNCSTGWYMSSAVDFGHGTGNFDRKDGLSWYSREEPGVDNRRYATPEQALASAKIAPKLVATLAEADNVANYHDAPVPWRITLAQEQEVNFFIGDFPYSDNQGGVSLAVTSVPVPASVLLLGPALLVIRRRRG